MLEFAAHELAYNIDRAFPFIESFVNILNDRHIDMIFLSECKCTFGSFYTFRRACPLPSRQRRRRDKPPF
jgi:hypothetical protein